MAPGEITLVVAQREKYRDKFSELFRKTYMSDLPPLTALRSFEAVARLGSISQAASELHVTHSAISQQ
ncbi:LysR family transcriptional regulator, partial [Pseudomonas aeruginosa]|uniref:LysR family transcriptional regulator n=1 Tax=Pseudomonas aeruginosa TaxID=287 RepID=UPI0032E4283F